MPTCWPSCVPELPPRPQRSRGRKPRGEYGSPRLWHQARAPSGLALLALDVRLWPFVDISIGSATDSGLEEPMDKPRIFLGSSGMQKKLVQALTRGLEDVAQVDPWTTSLNPGTTTLARLFELAHEVDFAAFVFARDDWTAAGLPESPPTDSGQASPRDNVVFEAGLFGGVLGMNRIFILHATGAKLPSDTVRRSDELRDQSCQREASEGDRE